MVSLSWRARKKLAQPRSLGLAMKLPPSNTQLNERIPPAGLEAQGVLRKAQRIRYEYNPHLPTELRSAKDAAHADKLPELLATARQRALSAEGAKVLADALKQHEA